MTIKPGVDIRGLSVQALLALVVAESVHREYHLECVVTSAVRLPRKDGARDRSLHIVGHAVDLRWHGTVSADVAKDLRERLGDQYDVVAEPAALGGAHIHVEFDPK